MSNPIKPVFQQASQAIAIVEHEYAKRHGNVSANDVPTAQVEATRWLRAVLRDNLVPLDTVIGRAKLEGFGLSVLWPAIRQFALQQSGLGGARYLSLPKTQWRRPDAVPAIYPKRLDPVAVMRRLVDSGDERIICQVCTYGRQKSCPGGYPIPGCIPNRCSFFQTANSESGKHEEL